MAQGRLPFRVQDEDGELRRGEIVIVPRWQPGIDLDPSADFTVILAQQPLAQDSVPPDAPNVAVCAPASGLRLPAAVAEPVAPYGAEAASPIRLTRRALDAFAGGAVLAAHPLSITPREIFGNGGRGVLLESLSRELLVAGRRADRCWHALDRILSWPRPPAPLARPDLLRTRLRNTIDRARPASASDYDGAAIDRLQRIASGAEPARLGFTPAALAEEAASVRCLSERPQAARELAAMRAYLAGAPVPSALADLAADRQFTGEQLSFATVLSEPHRFEGIRATFEMYRASYASAYEAHHRRYWDDSAGLRADLGEATTSVRALSRLNTLRALGRPVGTAALAEYARMAKSTTACSVQELRASLRERPTCPECNITLEDSAPGDAAAGLLHRIQTSLARQHARLAGEAVRRILARGGERLQQFLHIVQASDIAAMAHVLDDDLLAFLQELLSEPATPTPEALDLFGQLVRAHPKVSEDQVEAVVNTLRQLLIDRLAPQRAREPSQSEPFRLASDSPSR